MRPPGIGESKPGLAYARQKDDQDERSNKTTSNRDGSTTYEYKGELAYIGRQFHVGFTGSEKIDSTGKLLETHVKYDKPINQTFLGPSGDTVHLISNVKRIDTSVGGDGNYVTTITTADHRTVTFTTDRDGKILKVK